MSVTVFLEEVGIWLERLSEKIHSHQSWWIIQSTRGPKRTKKWKKGEFSLHLTFFLTGRCIFSCPWTSELLVLRPLVSGPFTSRLLVSRPSGWVTLAFLILQLASGRPQVFFISVITCEQISIWKKSLIHISVYPIGSVSWEHRVIQQSLLKITKKQLVL